MTARCRAGIGVLIVCLGLPAQNLKVRVKAATLEIPLERYVAQVLAGESSTFRSDQALQAMAIAARTYAVHFRGRHAAEGYDLCSTTHCQRVDTAGVTARLEAAADATSGVMLWFEGKPALAAYSRDCGGTTEDGAVVWSGVRAPYLRSHADPYCPKARWQWNAGASEIAQALTRSQLRVPSRLTGMEKTQRTAGGRAKELALEGERERVRVAASSFRFAIGRAFGFNALRSDLWEVEVRGERWEFTGTGDGHGAGLCQLGADAMGAQGKSYREILAFYYPGAALGVTARGLEWRRLGSESLTLMTTRPDRDRNVLGIAERQLREIGGKTGWTAPHGIELRVYPDTATFRDATGEPGWVAARASGTRIHLQPTAGELVIRHELLHVFVESHAVAGLPVWFREGLVEYLARPGGAGTGAVDDADLRQRQDEARARRAYAAAAARVAQLVREYGEGTVLGWLKSGVPKEVAEAKR